MNVIRQVVQNIDKMVKSLRFYNNLTKYYYQENPPKKTYHETDFDLPRILGDPHTDCEVCKLEDMEVTIKDNLFEYEGHCCWTLVWTNGFLIKGDTEHGIVRFNGRYYIFSSSLALKCFIYTPTHFINHVLQMARDRCGFIHFLKLSTDLNAVKDRYDLIETGAEDSHIAYAEAATQHEKLEESYIDRTYHFSLWKYKDEALRMATVKKCKTVSTMTHKTFFKNSTHSQTYLKREKELMTKSDNCTNTPTPLAFIQGLRGDKDNKKQAKLNLTYWDFKPTDFNKYK